MANLTPGDVIKQLQAGSHAGLYYLYGKDVAGVAAFTKRLIKKLDGEAISVIPTMKMAIRIKSK